jgi:hypothetical protein
LEINRRIESPAADDQTNSKSSRCVCVCGQLMWRPPQPRKQRASARQLRVGQKALPERFRFALTRLAVRLRRRPESACPCSGHAVSADAEPASSSGMRYCSSDGGECGGWVGRALTAAPTQHQASLSHTRAVASVRTRSHSDDDQTPVPEHWHGCELGVFEPWSLLWGKKFVIISSVERRA